jgi:acyl transferase domain-containing protein
VLEAPEVQSTLSSELQQQPFVLSAQSQPALIQLAKKFLDFLREPRDDLTLANVSYTVACRRAQFQGMRLGGVVDSMDTLRKELALVAEGKPSATLMMSAEEHQYKPKVVFMFTGQGSQYVGMGRDLYDTHKVFTDCMDKCADLLAAHQVPLLYILFSKDKKDKRVDETQFTQPCLFAIEYSLSKLWELWGVVSDAVLAWASWLLPAWLACSASRTASS